MSNSAEEELETRVQTVFAALPVRQFPPPLALATYLAEKGRSITPPALVSVDRTVAAMFMTAGVEMWHRAVHSFLYSAALTRLSPLWSAVSGYYASHYAVRAIAHVLGHFQVFSLKVNVVLSLQNGSYVCEYSKKGGVQGDHRFYWKKVNQHPRFANDALFPLNIETAAISDAAHRGIASYGDHLNRFSAFDMRGINELTSRVQQIASIEFMDPPIPAKENYPDIDSVQVVAYHRIVRFRRFLDGVLGGDSRFWLGQRSPAWCEDVIDFQLVDQAGLGGVDA